MPQALVVTFCILNSLIDLHYAKPTTKYFINPSPVSLDDDTILVEAATNSFTTKAAQDEEEDSHIDLGQLEKAMMGSPNTEFGEQLLHHYFDNDTVNPEELGPYAEGDLLIPNKSGFVRNGLGDERLRWPTGVIPFKSGGTFSNEEWDKIRNAMKAYHDHTCIKFVPHSIEEDYILFNNSASGCWASVGRIGGEQVINLQSYVCFRKPGTILHELMHVVGFLHEQNRHERDDYVKIVYENISPKANVNFEKVNTTNAFGVPYDYGSIMHYSNKSFSTNGKPTIIAMRDDPNVKNMGQRIGFSIHDLEKINKMYKCRKTFHSPESAVGIDDSEEVEVRTIVKTTKITPKSTKHIKRIAYKLGETTKRSRIAKKTSKRTKPKKTKPSRKTKTKKTKAKKTKSSRKTKIKRTKPKKTTVLTSTPLKSSQQRTTKLTKPKKTTVRTSKTTKSSQQRTTKLTKPKKTTVRTSKTTKSSQQRTTKLTKPKKTTIRTSKTTKSSQQRTTKLTKPKKTTVRTSKTTKSSQPTAKSDGKYLNYIFNIIFANYFNGTQYQQN